MDGFRQILLSVLIQRDLPGAAFLIRWTSVFLHVFYGTFGRSDKSLGWLSSNSTVCLSVCLSGCLSACLCLCLSVCAFVCQSVSASICVFVERGERDVEIAFSDVSRTKHGADVILLDDKLRLRLGLRYISHRT